MHVAEHPSSPYYRPKILERADSIRGPDTAENADYLPQKVRESIWRFLCLRAELLMSAPGLDRKTYQDFPPADRLSDDEDPEVVAKNTYSNGYVWPHRWISFKRSLHDEKQQAYSLLNAWRNEIKKDRSVPRHVLEVINEIIDGFYFGSDLCVNLRVRKPKNKFGHCVEDVEPRTLYPNLPEDAAHFMATAHNALLNLLHWLDQDISDRTRIKKENEQSLRHENDLRMREDALTRREKRHAAAVKKTKQRLAAEAERAKQLMDAANERMREAMMLAEMARRATASTQDSF